MFENMQELWQSYEINNPSDLDKYLENFRVLFAYHSGKIENREITFNDTREVFENGRVLNYTGTPRTLFEQQNQKVCYEFLKPRIIEKEPITIELIKEIHRALTEGTFDETRYIDKGKRPGEFKKHDYITGINEVGSAASDVEKDLQELLDEIKDYKGDKPLLASAYLHARFEYIHPFADGNGRVGRTLMNYFLMINNNPPLVIYDEDRHLYYDCLRVYDEAEEIEPLQKFLDYQIEKTWAKTLDLANGVKHERKGLDMY